ncbi:MAG: histidine kinase N-terminal 7TM domain-containing protein [Christensenellales bacterium]|jgi:two-component system sensor histidine kinase HupT/HoxJ
MDTVFYVTCATSFALIMMSAYIITRQNKSTLHYIFLLVILEVFIWTGAVMIQGLLKYDQQQFVIWEKVTYFASALMPVSLIILAKVYAQSDKELPKKYFLLLIVPIITLIVVWTNDYHNLFYVQYGWGGANNIPGVYFFIHAAYSYVCLLAGCIYLSYFAIKNSGLWSMQAVLIFLGSIIPTVVNVGYTLQLPGFNVYSTPIAFTSTLALYLLGMFRFNLLKVTPIALQTVINRISDSFIVLDTELNIIDYNEPFIDNFQYFPGLRKGENFYKILQDSDGSNLGPKQFRDLILSAANVNSTLVRDFETEIGGSQQYFTVEFTPIVRRNRPIAIILLFKNITQHIKDMEKIRENQAILLERERLASLGQLIGGIAHNLKTPIMSVAGGIDQLHWLAKEYTASISDPQVTEEDHNEIAEEMQQWLGKMKMHMGYMSDIISTVKDQAAKFNNPGQAWFTLDEMLKRVKILMHHELIKNKCRYKQDIQVDLNLRIGGDINSMVQILDNVIVNAIQAYEGDGGEIILKVTSEGNKLLMTICDFAKGINDKVKDRLFKEMITTKGKHGTGLGLYMSYSTIKGMFRGNMWFESSMGKGTKFYIQLPIYEEQLMEVNQYA